MAGSCSNCHDRLTGEVCPSCGPTPEQRTLTAHLTEAGTRLGVKPPGPSPLAWCEWHARRDMCATDARSAGACSFCLASSSQHDRGCPRYRQSRGGATAEDLLAEIRRRYAPPA